MSYKNSARNRRTKRNIIRFLNIITFKWTNLDLSHKLILVGSVLMIFSLFISWFSIWNNSYNSFNKSLWITWLLLLFNNIIILFFILSNKTKEIIKTLMFIKIKDPIFLLLINKISLILILNSFFIIHGLVLYTNEIPEIDNWFILSIVWLFFSFVWIFVYLKIKKDIVIEAKENDSLITKKNDIKTKNMKLPF